MGCNGGKIFGGETGFGVVDPMPTPAVCSVGGGNLSAEAVVGEDGNWVLTLTPIGSDYTLNGSVAAESGSVISAELQDDGSEVIVLAPADAVLQVFATCSDGSQTVTRVTISYDGMAFQIDLEEQDT